jgi:F420-non-reducing hydrogenase small subunit
MGNKVTVATTWLGGCSGCHISFLDNHEELVDILELIDIKYSPVMDVKEVPEVDVGIIEGSIANKENLEVALEIRKKSKIVIAFGSCACFGGIHGLRNNLELKDVLQRAYIDSETTINGKIPKHEDIPELEDKILPLRDVMKIDFEIAGCAPSPKSIKEALVSILNGKTPEKKKRNLCDECSREKVKLREVSKEFISDDVLSPCEVETINPDICFLEQGILCMGPATVEGCGAYCCENGNMPCKGCHGLVLGIKEQGARTINALSSLMPPGSLMFNEDIFGTAYRYTLPYAMSSKVKEDETKEDDDNKKGPQAENLPKEEDKNE